MCLFELKEGVDVNSILKGCMLLTEIIGTTPLSHITKEKISQSRLAAVEKLGELSKEDQRDVTIQNLFIMKKVVLKKKMQEKREKDAEVAKLSIEAQKDYEVKEQKKIKKKELAKQIKKGKMMMV